MLRIRNAPQLYLWNFRGNTMAILMNFLLRLLTIIIIIFTVNGLKSFGSNELLSSRESWRDQKAPSGSYYNLCIKLLHKIETSEFSQQENGPLFLETFVKNPKLI